jgi:predicted nucleic acid-binding protein
MQVLVDSSVCIEYFKSTNENILDLLIDEQLLCINEVILSELQPHIIHKNETQLSKLLEQIPKLEFKINWAKIRTNQLKALKSGINGIGIADLIIINDLIESSAILYSLDKNLNSLAKELNIKTIL